MLWYICGGFRKEIESVSENTAPGKMLHRQDLIMTLSTLFLSVDSVPADTEPENNMFVTPAMGTRRYDCI